MSRRRKSVATVLISTACNSRNLSYFLSPHFQSKRANPGRLRANSTLGSPASLGHYFSDRLLGKTQKKLRVPAAQVGICGMRQDTRYSDKVSEHMPAFAFSVKVLIRPCRHSLELHSYAKPQSRRRYSDKRDELYVDATGTILSLENTAFSLPRDLFESRGRRLF